MGRKQERVLAMNGLCCDQWFHPIISHWPACQSVTPAGRHEICEGNREYSKNHGLTFEKAASFSRKKSGGLLFE
jgi:hypothetical protein